MPRLFSPAFLLCALLFLGIIGRSHGLEIQQSQSATEIDAWDFLEVTLQVKDSTAKNPFTEVLITGSCQKEMQPGATVHGYCDSQNGQQFKIRFMPMEPGSYNFTITYQEGSFAKNLSGTFQVRDGKKKGMLQVHKQHPFHFQWAGTGEPYFWNGTTTYWLLGWEDENVIRASLERLAKLKVNHVRVALNARTHGGKRWDEPSVTTSPDIRYFFNVDPWVAKNVNHVEDPQFDTSRFHLHLWHKCERMLKVARELNIVVEIIFHLDGKDKGVDPFGKDEAGGEDEQLYYKHAAARLSAYSNVVWNLANEYQLFRDEGWVNSMGDHLKKCDPYDHLTTVHGEYGFKFRSAAWCDFAAYQSWDEKGGYAYMLENRQDQAAAGRAMPQVNEEYGYEDHYPAAWGDGKTSPARNAESRRRIAWEISMAGCYQTTGERANLPANVGGGWITGRGDASMTMLKGYAHMVEFFTSFPWFTTEPTPGLTTSGKAHVLATEGKIYAIYLPNGGQAEVKIHHGKYAGKAFNCRSGEWKPLDEIQVKEGSGAWKTPELPTDGDWAILLQN